MRVAVVGGGVLGCAVAASLAHAGVETTLVEGSRPGAGTSGTSFAWVNANSKQPGSYHALNAAGVDEHHAGAGRGGAWFHASGHVEVAENAAHAERLLAKVRRLRGRDYPAQLLAAGAVHDILPRLDTTVEAAAWFPREGYCDVSRFLAECLEVLRGNGGVVRAQRARHIEILASGVALELADATRVAVDVVVVAAGRWSDALLETIGFELPMHESTGPGDAAFGFLATTQPSPVVLDTVLTTTWLNARPDGHGRLVLQALDLDAAAHPGASGQAKGQVGRQLGERLTRLFGLPFGPPAPTAEVGIRALPADGLTVSGFVDPGERCYTVVTHSGVTLAPLLGRLAAEEILGTAAPLLQDFRPDRFSSGTASAAPAPARRPGEQ